MLDVNFAIIGVVFDLDGVPLYKRILLRERLHTFPGSAGLFGDCFLLSRRKLAKHPTCDDSKSVC